MHVVYRNSAIPLIFALFPNQTEQTYRRLIDKLLDKEGYQFRCKKGSVWRLFFPCVRFHLFFLHLEPYLFVLI
jgi:hypothetical protein